MNLKDPGIQICLVLTHIHKEEIDMAEKKTNVITIDGVDYNKDELSQDQTYWINQINNLQTKSANIRFELDQILVAQNAFTNSLIQSLKTENKKEAVNG